MNQYPLGFNWCVVFFFFECLISKTICVTDTNLLLKYCTYLHNFKVLYLSIYIFWWISNIRYLKILNIKEVANIQKKRLLAALITKYQGLLTVTHKTFFNGFQTDLNHHTYPFTDFMMSLYCRFIILRYIIQWAACQITLRLFLTAKNI